MYILFVRLIHLLGDLRYEVDCTFLVAHGRYMFQTEPGRDCSCNLSAFPTSMWVTFPPPRMGKCRRGMDAQERPTSAVQGCTNAAIAGRKRAAMWVIFVATPWNRITIIPGILPSTLRASFNCLNRSRRFIPRRCALCRDARVSQSQDVLERPLTCTPQNAAYRDVGSAENAGAFFSAHSTPSNRGF